MTCCIRSDASSTSIKITRWPNCVSPWYNHNGWLGVKKKVAHLCVQTGWKQEGLMFHTRWRWKRWVLAHGTLFHRWEHVQDCQCHQSTDQSPSASALPLCCHCSPTNPQSLQNAAISTFMTQALHLCKTLQSTSTTQALYFCKTLQSSSVTQTLHLCKTLHSTTVKHHKLHQWHKPSTSAKLCKVPQWHKPSTSAKHCKVHPWHKPSTSANHCKVHLRHKPLTSAKHYKLHLWHKPSTCIRLVPANVMHHLYNLVQANVMSYLYTSNVHQHAALPAYICYMPL